MLGLPAKASGYYGSNCVTYVREVTGMDISGNAGDWWNNAEGSYRRGHQPAAGAVLVFRPYGRMWAGHVAVVAKVVNGREILVNQANWPHGDVVEGAAVYDVSPSNDWTTVRVANVGTMSWGRDNPTFGFIYPDGAPAREETVVAQAQPEFPQPQSWATQPWPTQPQPQPRAQEPVAAQAQPRPQVQQPVVAQAQPQPRAEQSQPRVQFAVAETEEVNEPALRHAAPGPRDHEKAKAEKPATHQELAAKAKHDREQELLEAKAAKAKPDRHEHLEAKADHQRRLDKPEIKTAALDKAKADRDRREKLAAEKAEKTKLAKAEHDKAEQTKLAKAEHDKAEKVKLAKADHDKAEQTKLAKAEHEKAEKAKFAKAEKAEQTKLAKADHAPAKQHPETRTAAAHDHPASRRAHVARNDQQPVQGAHIEQIAAIGRGGE